MSLDKLNASLAISKTDSILPFPTTPLCLGLIPKASDAPKGLCPPLSVFAHHSVPFETGTRFLAVPLIEDADRKLHEFAHDRAMLVDRFLDSYPAQCESMSERLRVLHNPMDYPPIDMLRPRFYFAWRYVAYGVPGQLKSVSGRIWQEEREKAAQRFAEAQTEAQGLLRESISELVNYMLERLEASENSKPKVFKKSTVANLSEFLATFEFRNIANDTELKEQKARGLLAGVTADTGSMCPRFQLVGGIDRCCGALLAFTYFLRSAGRSTCECRPGNFREQFPRLHIQPETSPPRCSPGLLRADAGRSGARASPAQTICAIPRYLPLRSGRSE
jgi:hypothetical protein